MDRHYYFVKYVDIEEYNKQLSGVVSMRIKMRFKSLSMGLKLIDESFLAEILLYNFGINFTNYMDRSSQRFFKIENFYISEQESSKKKFTIGLLSTE